MNKTIGLAVLLACGVASAGTIHGDKAHDLMEGVRYAGITPTTAKKVRTFHVSAISCVLMLENDFGLGDYACTVDKLAVQKGTAYLLYRALDTAGFTHQAVSDTHIQIAVTGLTCVVDENNFDEELRYTCTGEGAGNKPHEVVITPKKRKVKDIVQPVKIEKQD